MDPDSSNVYPGVRVIPFQLIKKLIVVRAFVNGQEGNFIVDTGSESLVLNAKYVSGRRNRDDQVRDFTGSGAAFWERSVRFGWDPERGRNYRAIVTSFGLLERILDIPVMGYIGYNQLKHFEVIFDYPRKELALIPVDRRGWRKCDLPFHSGAADTILLRSNGHLPYLIATVDGRPLKLGIDSGSSLNLLRADVLPEIEEYFEIEGLQRAAGFNGRITRSRWGWLWGLQLGDCVLPRMRFLVADLGDLNATLPAPLDGVLGFEFLCENRVAVNYRVGQVYFWQRPTLLSEVEGSIAGNE